MQTKQILRFAIVLFVGLAMLPQAQAADETITFSEKGYSNAAEVAEVNGTNFKITFAKDTYSSNAPKYYTSGTAIRIYPGNTMVISSTTKTIEKIEITFGSSDGGNAITTDVDTYSSGTWTGSSNSVTFTIGGSSGNRRLSAVAVTYASACTPPATALSVTSAATATVGTSLSLTTSGGNGGAVTWSVTNGTGSATVSGSTLSPTGAGTVTVKAHQDQNSTTCAQDAEKTITISKASATITLSEAGSTSNVAGSHYAGDSYTLPTTTSATCGDKVLVGWSTVEINSEGTKPTSNYYDKGASVTLTAGSNTFYAVFATESAGGGTSWAKTTSIAVGDVVVFVNESNKDELTGVTTSGTTIGTATSYTTNPAHSFPLTIVSGSQTDSYAFKTSAGKYLSWSSGNSLTTSDNVADASSWTINTSTDGAFKFANCSTTTRIMQYNASNSRWACYTSSQTTFQIHKQTSSISYSNYSTTCCSNLGQINGSVILTQSGKNSLEVKWVDSGDGATADGYKLKLYKDNNGAKGTQVGSEKTVAYTAGTLGGGKKTFTYTFNSANGFTLEMNTKYWVSILPYSDGSGGKCTEGTEFVNNKDNSNNDFQTASCDKTLSLTVDKTGIGNATWSSSTVETCSETSATLTITPAAHYSLSNLTIKNGSTTYSFTPSVSANGGNYTVTIPQNATGTATATVTFKEDDKRTVKFVTNNETVSGATYTQSVYVGEKPTVPDDLASSLACDETSKTFICWTNQPWDGKVSSIPTGSKQYTKGQELPNVTAGTGDIVYYAVWAKETKGTDFMEVKDLDGLSEGDVYIGHYTKYSGERYYVATAVATTAAATVTSHKLTVTGAMKKYTLKSTGTAYKYYLIDADGKYLYSSATGTPTLSTTACAWTFSKNADYAFNMLSEKGTYYLNGYGTSTTAGALKTYANTTTNSPMRIFLQSVDYTDYMTTCCTNPELEFKAASYTIVREDLSSASAYEEINVDWSSKSSGAITWKSTENTTTNKSVSNTAASPILQIDMANKTVKSKQSGVYTVTIQQAAVTTGTPKYCAAEAEITITVKTIDKFVDLVNGNATVTKTDTGSGITTPAEAELLTNNACHDIRRKLVGWIKASDLSGYTEGVIDAYKTDDPTTNKIIAPNTSGITATGTTWYAVWALID